MSRLGANPSPPSRREEAPPWRDPPSTAGPVLMGPDRSVPRSFPRWWTWSIRSSAWPWASRPPWASSSPNSFRLPMPPTCFSTLIRAGPWPTRDSGWARSTCPASACRWPPWARSAPCPPTGAGAWPAAWWPWPGSGAGRRGGPPLHLRRPEPLPPPRRPPGGPVPGPPPAPAGRDAEAFSPPGAGNPAGPAARGAPHRGPPPPAGARPVAPAVGGLAGAHRGRGLRHHLPPPAGALAGNGGGEPRGLLGDGAGGGLPGRASGSGGLREPAGPGCQPPTPPGGYGDGAGLPSPAGRRPSGPGPGGGRLPRGVRAGGSPFRARWPSPTGPSSGGNSAPYLEERLPREWVGAQARVEAANGRSRYLLETERGEVWTVEGEAALIRALFGQGD